MKFSRFPITLAAALFLILASHFIGLAEDWYHIFWWYDIPMHIAGGAWVAAAFLYSARKYQQVARIINPTFFRVLGVVFVVGIGWEIFEYSVDVFIFQKYTFSTIPLFILIDSVHDLANDLLGAFFVVVWSRRT